ncbi:SMC6 [Lepeophtheirus salmonis]|uniref:SMC6 n=1 Tax=Lepeophtheirus salmonis TaxID=72036 RepID=A0A7R8CIA4_LEPSM|nr:SMC6 [Lepeophtheirus salmonis]CAF2776324.1 SMC6 [Lepeophtheirus salmonis]
MKRPAEEDSQQRVSKSLRGEKEDWERLPGMIEKVVLKQFMCHQEFVYSPTRRVNFVAGQNGSGKSAVLTGILFGLGGKAKDLGKSSLKDLIREGSNGFRSINRSGGNSYKFKDAKGHIVPVKKPSKELSRILTAFSIQITNPSIETRRKDIKGMKAELAWSIVKELENQDKEITLSIDNLNKKVQKYDNLYMEKNEVYEKLKSKKDKVGEDLKSVRATEEALQEEKYAAKQALQVADTHVKSSSRKMDELKRRLNQIREHRHEMSASKSKMETLSKRIKSLQGLKDNKFAVYGSDMVNLCAALEDNYRLFKHKPIGPLGAFIRFKSGVTKSQKILVDSELRKLCQAFIFDNYEDKTVFEKFARNYNYKGSKYTLTFRKDIYDFDDANIANCLIDHRKIEKILILPTESLAQKMFSQSSPKNCSYGLVYSEERHCACSYYSHPYRSYMSAQLSQQLLIQSNVGEHLVGLEKELNAAQLEYNAIQEAHDSLKSGNIKLNYEERSLSKKKINEQQRIITEKSAKLNVINSEEQTEEPPMDVVVMEEDLEGFEEMKGRLSDELESESEQFASVKESLERKMLNIQSDINQIDKERNRITQKKTEFSEMISTKQEDKDKVSLEIDKHLQKAKKWSEERIDTIRSKDEIYNKIQAAEQSLKERQERVHESPETITKEYGRLGNLFRSVYDKMHHS